MIIETLLAAASLLPSRDKVEFRDDPSGKRIEVHVGGRLFTAFIHPDDMEKPCLYPILTASGKTVTRGYPMDPRPFERTDHPHHVGLWLNFGDVNGLDFWNNSFAIPAAEKHRYGSVRFRRVVSRDEARGTLSVASDWVDHKGAVLLSEETTYRFSGGGGNRVIDRITKLTAVVPVLFRENKEGLIGLRVDRAFEEPSTRPEKYLDARGIETEVAVMNNDGVNGVYRNADGVKGSDVWGKRSAWVALRAVKEGEAITLAIIDHSGNPNHPAWSHARGYGLFATNNLGGRKFEPGAEEVRRSLKPGESISFRHRVVVGGDLTDAQIGAMARAFK